MNVKGHLKRIRNEGTKSILYILHGPDCISISYVRLRCHTKFYAFSLFDPTENPAGSQTFASAPCNVGPNFDFFLKQT